MAATPGAGVYNTSPVFKAVMLTSAIVLFALLVSLGRRGNAWATAIVILAASPVAMAIINRLEGGDLWHMFNPSIASWVFVFGDLFALTWAGWHISKAWKDLPAGWFSGLSWVLGCVVIGIAAALAFHFVLDGPGYIEAGATAQLSSRSKEWHDFVAYPVLFGGLVYLVWPVVWAVWRGDASADTKQHLWLALAGAGSWAVLGMLDMFVHKPSPFHLHPPGEKWPA